MWSCFFHTSPFSPSTHTHTHAFFAFLYEVQDKELKEDTDAEIVCILVKITEPRAQNTTSHPFYQWGTVCVYTLLSSVFSIIFKLWYKSVLNMDSSFLAASQICVCLLLQDLLQSCSRGGEEESGRHVL